ncbi:hypothetical protein HAX54_037424, partial [Datura stramonium]|nr:hypothetical protein [Datura stramonium]
AAKRARDLISGVTDIGTSAGAGAKSNDDAYVEITLDVREDSVAVHSVKTAGGADVEDPGWLYWLRPRGKSTLGIFTCQKSSSSKNSASLSSSAKPTAALDGPPSKRFDEITSSPTGLLPQAKFGRMHE